MSEDHSRITRLLRKGARGDEEALDQLLPLVYDDLRRIAHNRLRSERARHTLNTTALVHEAYLRLVGQTRIDWVDRAHFFAVASRIMRRVLVDYARRRQADKRGGDAVRVPLEERMTSVEPRFDDLLALDEALTALTERDERLGRVVECRFFGGMTVEETAQALDVSERTVARDWDRAKTYLYDALAPDEEGSGGASGAAPSDGR